MNSTKAIVCTPHERYAEGITSEELRQKWGKPDYGLALQQHKAYCDALRQAGIIEIIDLAGYRALFDHPSPDDCFVEDVAVFTDYGAVITNPGHPQRRAETDVAYYALVENNIAILGCIEYPGYLDGGDVVRVQDHYFLGYSDRSNDIRTNHEGLDQLEAILKKYGYSSSRIPVRTPLHLSTGSSHAGDGGVFTNDELSSGYINHDYYDSYDAGGVWVLKDEEYAANLRSVNGYVLMPAGFPKTKKVVADYGYKVIELDMSEFRKQNGSMTCLSLLIPDKVR